jgi:hypothetical protein
LHLIAGERNFRLTACSFSIFQEDVMRTVFSLQKVMLAVSISMLCYCAVIQAQPLEFSWRAAESIYPARYYHTATILNDGTLLVTGGRQGFEPLRSVRVFDPTMHGGTSGWIVQPDMADRRERHQATLMPAGWVLISGGLDGIPIRGCELLDPVTKQYQLLPDLLEARYEHTATYLSGGRVLAVGSKDYDRGLASCEIFEALEVAHGASPLWRWRRTASLHFGRGKHRAVRLNDGRVLVIGGVHNYRPTSTCEAFDPGTETWRLVAPMSTAREGHTATLLHDGRVLVTGGDIGGAEITTCEIFDPTKNSGYGEWTKVAPTNFPRKNHTATLVSSRYIILTGAWRVGHGDRSTEIMDTWDQSANWYQGPTMLETRSNHSATLLPDGRLLLIGGEILGHQDATSACDISERTLDVSIPERYVSVNASVWPNPSTHATQIEISFDGTPPQEVAIRDMLGRTVRRLLPDESHGVSQVLIWDGLDERGSAVAAGMYFAIAKKNAMQHVMLVQRM